MSFANAYREAKGSLKEKWLISFPKSGTKVGSKLVQVSRRRRRNDCGRRAVAKAGKGWKM